MAFRILSCDGGGIRGYISSSLIQALNTQTKGKFLSEIDGYAGTSTGSLIAIALASGVDIDKVVTLYKTQAAEIFTKNPDWCILSDIDPAAVDTAATPGPLGSPGALGSRYVATGLKKALTPFLGTKTFADIAAKMLVVNSAQLNNPKAAEWAPANFNNKGVDGDYSRTSLIDAALASSAAPAYFPPHQIGGLGWFADGGTYANNPVLNAIEVALHSKLASGLGDIQILSFGTGLTTAGIPTGALSKPNCWGVTSWMYPFESRGAPATPLLNLTLDLASQNLERIARQILPKDNLVRINPALRGDVALDDYSAKDYAIMDKAISDAQKDPTWQAAINLVNSW